MSYLINITTSSLLLIFSLNACGVLRKKPEPDPQIIEIAKKPIDQEARNDLLKEYGRNWAYGEGFGTTLLNVGGIVAFPPYALFVLGNGAISMAGYEPLGVSYLLNEENRTEWNKIYGNMVSGPGRITAAAADEKYRDRETADNIMREKLNNVNSG